MSWANHNYWSIQTYFARVVTSTRGGLLDCSQNGQSENICDNCWQTDNWLILSSTLVISILVSPYVNESCKKSLKWSVLCHQHLSTIGFIFNLIASFTFGFYEYCDCLCGTYLYYSDQNTVCTHKHGIVDNRTCDLACKNRYCIWDGGLMFQAV